MQFGILTRIFLVIHLNFIGNFGEKISSSYTLCKVYDLENFLTELPTLFVQPGSYINLEDKQLFFKILILEI